MQYQRWLTLLTEVHMQITFSPHENRELHSKNKQGLFKPVLYPFRLHNCLISTAKEHIMNSNSSRKVKVAEKVLITSLFELTFPFIFEKSVIRYTEAEVQQFGTSYRMYALVGIFIVRSNVKI